MQHMGILWMLDIRELATGAIGPPVRVAPQVPALFQRAGPQHVDELVRVMEPTDLADTISVFQQRFASGRQCYIARVEGRVVAYGWVTFDEEKIGELGLSIRLAPGEAYIWDCATQPAFRGQRLYPALVTYIVDELWRAGLRRIWIGTDADNFPSQNGLALSGFQPVADVMIALTPTARQLIMRGRPGVSEEVVSDARRALFGEQEFWSSAIA